MFFQNGVTGVIVILNRIIIIHLTLIVIQITIVIQVMRTDAVVGLLKFFSLYLLKLLSASLVYNFIPALREPLTLLTTDFRKSLIFCY